MDRNQKIALGCGGAGCLGLIILGVLSAVIWFVYVRRPVAYTANRNSNVNVNVNHGFNRNSGYPTQSSSSPASTSSSSMSDDQKHRLFQAAGLTKDSDLIQKVLKKLGFMRENGTTTDEYAQFVKDHFAWAVKNLDFVNSVNSPEKARAYVNDHLND